MAYEESHDLIASRKQKIPHMLRYWQYSRNFKCKQRVVCKWVWTKSKASADLMYVPGGTNSGLGIGVEYPIRPSLDSVQAVHCRGDGFLQLTVENSPEPRTCHRHNQTPN